MVRQILVKAQALTPKGKALDIGAGNGFDALFLACKGFEVTALESSADFCKEIEQMQIPNIKTACIDVCNFSFEEQYNLINCTFVLHFLGKKAREIITKIQDATAHKGINVIATFLNEGEFERLHEGYLKPGELKELYKGWEELFYSEEAVPTKERNPDGSIKKQKAVFALFRKH